MSCKLPNEKQIFRHGHVLKTRVGNGKLHILTWKSHYKRFKQ